MLAAGVSVGPYEIVSALGSGGMGQVYRAWDRKLGRPVAVKILSERLASDPAAMARFEREARAVAALSHPDILGIHEFGCDDGAPYAVMELLEGRTLRQILARASTETGPALPLWKALGYAAQIVCGLAAAHEKGDRHRDLKPENIFVTADGRIKILDFGLARVMPIESDGRTKQTVSGVNVAVATRGGDTAFSTDPGTVLGTLGYMAPEQLRGQATDARADIFSFGAAWLPHGRGVLTCGTVAGRAQQCFVQSLDPNEVHARTPEGIRAERSVRPRVSPDGSMFVAIGPDGRPTIYPIDGGAPRHVPGLDTGETVIEWTTDGRALFVKEAADKAVRIWRLDHATAERALWREIVVPDPAGVMSDLIVLVTPDGLSYAVVFSRLLSTLDLASDLR